MTIGRPARPGTRAAPATRTSTSRPARGTALQRRWRKRGRQPVPALPPARAGWPAIRTCTPNEGAPPTPDNPIVAGNLAVFQYGIDNVTVDNTNAATITFWIKKNGAFVNFLPGATDNVAVRPTGFSGGPSFLIAHSGSAANPQDYTNWDEVASHRIRAIVRHGTAEERHHHRAADYRHGQHQNEVPGETDRRELLPGEREDAGGRPPGVLHPDQRDWGRRESPSQRPR